MVTVNPQGTASRGLDHMCRPYNMQWFGDKALLPFSGWMDDGRTDGWMDELFLLWVMVRASTHSWGDKLSKCEFRSVNSH